MAPVKHEAWQKQSDLLGDCRLGNCRLYMGRIICLFGSLADSGKPSNVFATLAAVISYITTIKSSEFTQWTYLTANQQTRPENLGDWVVWDTSISN